MELLMEEFFERKSVTTSYEAWADLSPKTIDSLSGSLTMSLSRALFSGVLVNTPILFAPLTPTSVYELVIAVSLG